MRLLRAERLRVSYGKKEVIHGVDFEISAGEFCALLGLNGSGKTTLLKSVCGLIPVCGGSCYVDDMPYLSLDERRRALLISYIPQRHGSISGTSLLDVVLMGFNPHLPLLSSPGSREKQLASSALSRVGLGGMDDADFEELSEGQKQLVILARAIVQDCPVMLPDEPVSSLDFVNCHYVLSLMREIIHENKRAGLITLHDPNFALYYCDRLLLLKDGVIVSEIIPSETSSAQIRERLSLLYGGINVLEHNGSYFMVKKPQQPASAFL